MSTLNKGDKVAFSIIGFVFAVILVTDLPPTDVLIKQVAIGISKVLDVTVKVFGKDSSTARR